MKLSGGKKNIKENYEIIIVIITIINTLIMKGKKQWQTKNMQETSTNDNKKN